MAVGRLRPDFLARCAFSVLKQACTGDAELIREGRLSFPSGHSARTASGLGMLALYLAGKTKALLLDGGAWRRGGRSVAVLSIVGPVIGVIYVGEVMGDHDQPAPCPTDQFITAVSRLQANMHHWEDVLVGDIIGFTFAYLVYRFYFPSPFVDSAYIGKPKAEAEENGLDDADNIDG